MSNISSWWQFTKERFEPVSHLLMILVFLVAHIFIAGDTFGPHNLPLLIGVIAFYYKLRLYDEVKDYELDVVINKTRPLPRGLLTLKDMYRGMVVCIVIELICFGMISMNALYSGIIAILYSLLMYKEFFIKDAIRPLLTTYALMHTIVTTFLSIAIFSAITDTNFLAVMTNFPFLSFALANWMLFNIFEFGRKTFATSEERENIDTYSSLFGRTGAVVLVASQALIAHYLVLNIKNANVTFMFWCFGPLLLTLAVLSVRYIVSNTVNSAKHYRLFSSVYIIVFYLILIASIASSRSP